MSAPAPRTIMCGDCPWRASNHRRKPDPHGFFSVANRKRLWKGLRTGEAPGMTCHGTDPRKKDPGSHGDYGETAGSEATHECAGALACVQRELLVFQNIAQGIDSVEGSRTKAGLAFTLYRKLRPGGMTRGGMANWVMRATGMDPFAGRMPDATEASLDQLVGNGLPWDGAAVTLPRARAAGVEAALQNRAPSG